jgi:NodT family efflux transporter outer membrane factor (OMF) lipoprotein
MKKKYIITIILVAVTLNSCGIYTKYQRPEDIRTDSLYRDIPSAASDSSSLAAVSWRELFNDKKLQSLIEIGLKSNSDIQTARLKVTEAEATLHASKMAFLPSASLGTQGKLSSFDGEKAMKTYSISGDIDWEIDAFGSLRNTKKGDEAALRQNKAYVQAVQTKLVATIADSYYTLLMLDKELAITTATVATWKENVQTMRALKEAGQETEVAVAQNEASLLSEQNSMLKLQQQIHEQENAISTLIGITPQQIERGSLDEIDFPQSLSAGLPVKLLGNRPDVRQAEYSLEQSFYNVNKARSAFYPNITLSGSAGWTNSSGAAIMNPGKILLSALGSLSQPIFNKGKNTANLKIAQAQYEEVKISFQQTLLEAGADVNNALVQWQTARQKQTIDNLQIEKLNTAFHNTQLLMDNGTINYLEVLTARQSLLKAQISLAEDRYNEIAGVIKLYHALG